MLRLQILEKEHVNNVLMLKDVFRTRYLMLFLNSVQLQKVTDRSNPYHDTFTRRRRVLHLGCPLDELFSDSVSVETSLYLYLKHICKNRFAI